MFTDLYIHARLPKASAWLKFHCQASFCKNQKLETVKQGFTNKQWLKKNNYKFKKNVLRPTLPYQNRTKRHNFLKTLRHSFSAALSFLWRSCLNFEIFGLDFSLLRITFFPALFLLRQVLWSSTWRISLAWGYFCWKVCIEAGLSTATSLIIFSFERRLLSGKSLSIYDYMTSRSSDAIIWSTFTVRVGSQIQSLVEPFEFLSEAAIDRSSKHVVTDVEGICEGVYSSSSQSLSVRRLPFEEQNAPWRGGFHGGSL